MICLWTYCHFSSSFLFGFCLSVFPLVPFRRLCAHILKRNTFEWETFTHPTQVFFFPAKGCASVWSGLSSLAFWLCVCGNYIIVSNIMDRIDQNMASVFTSCHSHKFQIIMIFFVVDWCSINTFLNCIHRNVPVLMCNIVIIVAIKNKNK